MCTISSRQAIWQHLRKQKHMGAHSFHNDRKPWTKVRKLTELQPVKLSGMDRIKIITVPIQHTITMIRISSRMLSIKMKQAIRIMISTMEADQVSINSNKSIIYSRFSQIPNYLSLVMEEDTLDNKINSNSLINLRPKLKHMIIIRKTKHMKMHISRRDMGMLLLIESQRMKISEWHNSIGKLDSLSKSKMPCRLGIYNPTEISSLWGNSILLKSKSKNLSLRVEHYQSIMYIE